MDVLYIVSGTSALMVAAGNLFRKGRTPANIFFSLLLIVFGSMLGYSGIKFPHILGLIERSSGLLTLLAAAGILIYLLFVSLAGINPARKKNNWFPFLLLIPSILSDILIYIFNVSKIGVDSVVLFVHIINIAVWTGVIFLCAVSIIHVFKLYFPKSMSKPAWIIFMISIIIMISFMIGFSGFLLSDTKLSGAMDIFIVLMIFAIALLDFRFPDALLAFRDETVKRRYERSLLAGLDIEGLIQGMSEMLARTNVYRNPGFTLDLLAQRMGLSTHQVSELLNDRMGTNFSAYINAFRIEDAKRLLTSSPDSSILAIAMEAGFGNKTSFNESFKRLVHMTPKQFRETKKISQ